MNIFSTLRLSGRSLWRNKVRSSLTMLGIIIGIGAVIAMVSVGRGAQAAVKQVFTNMGTNVLILSSQSNRELGPSSGSSGTATLTWDDVKALQEGEIPTIKYVAPVLSTRTQVVSEDANWNTTVVGTTASWFKVRNWDSGQEGSLLDEETGNSTAKVAVIGTTVAKQLFGTASPLGKSVRLNGQPFEIIGVLASKGQGPMGDNDDTIIIPLKTYQQKLERGVAKYVRGMVLISMKSDDDAEKTMAGITTLLRDRHKLDAAADDDFRIRNPAEFAKAQQESTNRIATLLAIVAAASLLVGGIGVMNIMLISVIERTREIGIRSAVGARPVSLMTQFLIEALMLSILGGLLGLAVGYYAAQFMAGLFGFTMVFPAQIAAVAFAVAGGVGVVFGLYPALRASQLDPITALRYES